MQKIMRLFCFLTLLNSSMLALAIEPAVQQEIDQLLDKVAQSGCEFNRNGKLHNATDAKAHLQLKLRRGGKYVSSTETFIDRLASKSSWSGDLYTMECPGQLAQPAGEWLHANLTAIRQPAS